MRKNAAFSDLLGQTIQSVERLKVGSDYVTFLTKERNKYDMYHDQECCEDVSVEDIVGDVEDILGLPILIAEEVTNAEWPSKGDVWGDEEWTFYRLGTEKGIITIRWYGTSNGYYSTGVTFEQIV